MFYLDKIVVGPDAADAIDIDAPAETNVRAVAKALGKNTDDLTVCILDQLIALYEHITFTQGIAWGIDSFDQWGVELGKQLALKVTPAVGGDEAALAERDPSTQGLIRYYREQRS